MIKKLLDDRFEFSTMQPKIERYTIKEMYHLIQVCDDDIAIQEIIKAEWEAKIAGAEALNGSV